LVERVAQVMIRSAYLAGDAIPLTTPGKTDRQRLREIARTIKAESHVEERIAPFSLLGPGPT
jgi:acyl-CoA synthetase (AMP-forming)/AMP-acid ligase II